ncbi:MAG: class I SAM-dependent methyltransferase [Phycisphaerae bacterium]|nr:class I SAM-dependent methyltransferase [Phycisphaerae bacterium]
MNPIERLKAALERRAPLLKSRHDDAYRLVHGEGDGLAGVVIDRFGEVLVAQVHEGRCELDEAALREVAEAARVAVGAKAVYRKTFPKDRSGGTAATVETAHRDPTAWVGESVGEAVIAIENDLRYEIRPYDGFSVGLFCEQRLNRKRVREMFLPPRVKGRDDGSREDDAAAAEGSAGEEAGAESGAARDEGEAQKREANADAPRVLNLFAYTCAFSVAAASAGAVTASVDVSKRFLEWGKRNFALNNLALDAHRFYADDVMDYFKRANKKLERFDLIIADPPTFARAREGGRVFALPDAWPALLSGCVSLLAPRGQILICTNHRATARRTLERMMLDVAGRRSCRVVMRPSLPIDFPGDPDFAKSILVQLDA